jgi:8-oxo-dGTP pyrophosphatase MutT (NUDIX family)
VIISNYQGASLLIMTRDKEGQLHVLLGKRLNRPGKNQWSFPGGQRDGKKCFGPFGFKYFQYKPETLAQTAIRETDEELIRWRNAPNLPQPAELSLVWSLKSPVFTWSTFLWLVDNPELKLPTNSKNPEFAKLAWFTAEKLPEPLHFGAKPAVRKALRYVQKSRHMNQV